MQDLQGIVAATLKIARLKDIRDIALFNAIVACGSLSAPGRQLGLSLLWSA
jgi:molybdenum-dependent DNA-binding transcriptional regulator ModE